MKNRTPFAPSLLIILVVAVVAAVASACATKEKRLSRVMVTGEADVKAPPDTAVIVLSVVTQNGRALDAQQQNARKSDAVMQAVKEAAGANPEVRTTGYSLEPQRNWNGSMPKIVGYEARNSVTVTTGQLDNVGAVIDAATQAGANSVESVAFILRENNPARGQTLSDATKQAMGKAQSIAQALGGRVVRIVEQQEGGFVNRRTGTDEERNEAYPSAAAMANTATDAAKQTMRTPVEAGSLSVKSQVQLIVEIEAQTEQQ
ncbi:MAG TPA: SIMPL domain-containing protein [Pyrinomonadaceae bacterium]|nr:SIMPL domain-containing protein [Pyrinomonadaceae bacterium]